MTLAVKQSDIEWFMEIPGTSYDEITKWKHEGKIGLIDEEPK